MPFSAKTLSNLRDTVERVCIDPKNDIPGVTVVVVGKDGKELFAHAAGKRGLVSKEPMTLENIFWIASCTKMLTGLACMQLVEQGTLKLDDGNHLENILPELKDIQVLREDGTFEAKTKQITLRMLLTHTSGFGYTFFNERLRNWAFPAGADEFSGRIEDIISLPLLFQPGEGWEYGVSRVEDAEIHQYLYCLIKVLTNHHLDWHRLGWIGPRASDRVKHQRVPTEERFTTHRRQGYVNDSYQGHAK